MLNLKLHKLPLAMDFGGKRNVALFAHRVKRDEVKNVMCIYETVDGEVKYFRNALSPERALGRLEFIKSQVVQGIQ